MEKMEKSREGSRGGKLKNSVKRSLSRGEKAQNGLGEDDDSSRE